MLSLYIVLFVFILITELLHLQKKVEWNRLLFYSIGGILVLFSTFRDGSKLPDYNNYVGYYDEILGGGFVLVEYSFVIIAYIADFLFHNVFGLFFIYAVLGVYLKLYAIRRLTDLCFLSLLIYVANTYLIQELIQIRAGIASAFLLLCIEPLYNRNLKKFLLFSIIAFFFHNSAIAIFPLWFLNVNKINRLGWGMLIPFGYCIALLKINPVSFIPVPFVQDKINLYLSVKDTESINIFSALFITKCLIAYAFLYYIHLLGKYNKYLIVLLKIFILSLLAYLFFSATPTLSFRLQGLLEIVDIILIPYMIYMFKPWSIGKLFPIAVSVLYIFLVAIHTHIISG